MRKAMEKDIERILISAEEIERHVAEIGRQITRDYRGKDPIFIGVLKGCFIFMADLMRHVNVDCSMDFMAVSSYKGTTSTGAVKINKDLSEDIGGRHIILKYIMKKDRTRENAVLYGIGHGGIEILAVLLPSMVTYLAVALLFSAGDTENALRALNITEETAAAALPSVQAAAAFDYGMMALNVLERLFAMLLHIGLTVIVFYGVVNRNKLCLPLAILLHMLMDTFPALYQAGALPLWAVEVWAAFWTVVADFIGVKLYRRMKAPSAPKGPAGEVA